MLAPEDGPQHRIGLRGRGSSLFSVYGRVGGDGKAHADPLAGIA